MKTLGGGARGVSLPTWINWISVDISADMAYNREMNALKDSKSLLIFMCAQYRKMLTFV